MNRTNPPVVARMGVGAPLEDRATPGTVIGPVVFLVLAIGATVRGYALERGG